MQISGGRSATTGVALFAAATALAGCGGSDKDSTASAKAAASVAGAERGVIGTVDALQTASRNGDGEGICADLFTVALARSVKASSKRSCVKEVEHTLVSPDAAISVSRDIRVTGSRATATIRERNGSVSKLFLLKQGAGWRIDRVEPAKAE